jgi:SPX domain protein involved in polyphosphate accumulation
MSFLINSHSEHDFRNEVKYTHLNTSRESLVQKINKSRYIFKEIHHKRWINNIYFDSRWLDLYITSVEGVSDRTKVRMRWYGDGYGEIFPVIEFKMKRGYKNIKSSYKVGKICINKGDHKKDIVSKILKSEILPYEIKEVFKNLIPVLRNRYYRSYHISSDNKHRITIDSNLCFVSLLKSQKMIDNFKCADHLLILELKFKKNNQVTKEIMSDIGNFYRIDQISKYTYGLSFA